MNEAEREFHPQEQFGRVLNENEFLMFQVLMHSPETIVSLFHRKFIHFLQIHTKFVSKLNEVLDNYYLN